MGLSNFTLHTFPDVTITIQPNTPIIEGNQETKIFGTGKGAYMYRTDDKAFTAGKFRTLWKPKSSNLDQGLIITCMQSDLDLTLPSNYYALYCTGETFSLRKIENGTLENTGTILVSETFSFEIDSVYAIELQWQARETQVLLSAKRALGNFSSLVETIRTSDAFFPLLTTAGEGIGISNFGDGPAFDHRVDDMSVYRLVF